MSAHTLYQAFFAPRARDAESQSREATLNTLLLGTMAMALVASLIVARNILVLHEPVFARLMWCVVVLCVAVLLFVISRVGHYVLASYLCILTYFMIVSAVMTSWGINVPEGVLLAGFVITMSGILLSARHALYAAVLNITLLVLAKYVANPDLSWKSDSEGIGDILILGITFLLIAIVCWRFDSQIKRSLQRAERSEAALRRQAASLERKVTQRTRKLHAAQMEQFQQVYRFAELGLVSTALLHDIANRLSAMSVDLQGLQEERNSQILARIRRTVRYIDTSVQETRHQLQGQGATRRFSVTKAVREIVELLTHQADAAGVQLAITDSFRASSPRLRGDVTRFKQLLATLITNAIEAYAGLPPATERRVDIRLSLRRGHLHVEVADRGVSIPPAVQRHLFTPFYTTKKQGMGLGLFLAREIAERGFGGTLEAVSRDGAETVFSVTIPLERA